MKKSNVIAFERGAEFYFELGNKKIQKGNLSSALIYIEKAVKLKPNDSFIQFNYAGLLAEMGNVELSTEILLKIVNELEPNYNECYFGLGCNFLQMQKIKKSVEYFTKYLEKDPEGEFSEESEDLLEMLTMIKDANNNLDDEELEKIYALEEEAMKHLDKHEYKEAVVKFEQVVEILPNAVPARNNLSLVYYYLGETQKAIDLAREVLGYENYNVHANCNIALFYNKLNLSNWVEKQIKVIKKLNTENPEYVYKIADTLGCLGKHKDAYKVYKKLISIEPDNILYIHYTAVAAFNSGRYDDSIKYWRSLLERDKQNLISEFYIALAERVIDKEEQELENKTIAYSYQLPKEEISRRVAKTQEFIEGSIEKSKEILTSKDGEAALYYCIFFDRILTRKIVFDKIKRELLREGQNLLRKLLIIPDLEDEIKIEAIFLLDIIGEPQPYIVNFAGEIMEITADPLSIDIYAVNCEWKDIIKNTQGKMKGFYKGAYKRYVENIWISFIKYNYPDTPRIMNIDVWAAALEYAYCRLNNIKTSQSEIAGKYSVSVSAISGKYKQILDSVVKRANYIQCKKK